MQSKRETEPQPGASKNQINRNNKAYGITRLDTRCNEWGKGDASGQAAPLIGILSGLLAQSGGLQGLANKFSQSGQGDTFSSWVGMGENQSISSNQIQNVLGSEQVKALAAKMGVDPTQASHFLAEYLPKIVDKLTPEGKVDP